MSRPDPAPGTSGHAAYGRAGDPAAGAVQAPLRVIAERLSDEDARAAEAAEVARIARVRERRAALSTVAPSAAAPLTAVTTMTPPGVAAGVTPRSPAPGTVAPPTGALTPVAAPGLPVLSPVARRSGFAELFAMITGRRQTGRHRPDCVRSQSWSMFSPQRRPRRTRRSWLRSRV